MFTHDCCCCCSGLLKFYNRNITGGVFIWNHNNNCNFYIDLGVWWQGCRTRRPTQHVRLISIFLLEKVTNFFIFFFLLIFALKVYFCVSVYFLNKKGNKLYFSFFMFIKRHETIFCCFFFLVHFISVIFGALSYPTRYTRLVVVGCWVCCDVLCVTLSRNSSGNGMAALWYTE